jgi:LDH2 family malate/lactate/ureidoglycolate dehydrogenase
MDKRTISYNQLDRFIRQIFAKIGCPPDDTNTISDVLLKAELRGIPSHGLMRIPDYIMLWEKGRAKSRPDIKIIHQTPSTAVIDGDAAFGMIAAKKAMLLAIEKAKSVGSSWVAVKNSNHFGIAGYFAMLALEHDMAGIAMTNANPLVAPTWSVDRLLGTNPLAVAIPAGEEPPFVADFATTPIARGKLELLSKKGFNAPFGFVQDKAGAPSNDPNILRQGGAMLTLGGDYEHGSHKGYCMSAIIDIFSAIFSGANFGPFVPPSVGYLDVRDDLPGQGTGHFFGALRIDAFQPSADFKRNMDHWIQTFRNATPTSGFDKVLIPGDPERENEQRIMKEGIEILPAILSEITDLASKLGVNLD